jgi:squalene-hopene/tetraprenyl-beta-curcumene cyclase
MHRKKAVRRLLTFPAMTTLALVGLLSSSLLAETPGELNRRVDALIDKGLTFLKDQQKPDGGWASEKEPPAITALVLRAFVLDPKYPVETPFVRKGFDRLLSFQLENGGIYRDLLANYNTAIAISALAAANRDEYRERLDKAVAYLKGLQWTEATRPEHDDATRGQQVVRDEKDPFFGGWGYGGRSRGAGRPDLSNAQMALDALHDAGIPPSDPAFQRALAFVSRLQNHRATNDQPWAGDDGGFIYGPADTRKGESFAGEYTTSDGDRRLRSYGSMTYAGLKSMIYAGLTRDDPRVQAAWKWITSNWTLDENPGMRHAGAENAQHGLYYYYHTLARALNEYDQPVIETADGKRIDWRVAFVEQLEKLQKPDGSFVGDARWMEANPVLVTSYVVLALHEVRKDLAEHPPK